MQPKQDASQENLDTQMNSELLLDALSVVLSARYDIDIKIKGEKSNEGENEGTAENPQT